MSADAADTLTADLIALIKTDAHVMGLLNTCRDVLGEGAWLSAGKIRNTVWDLRLGGTPSATHADDADVLIFKTTEMSPELETRAEAELTAAMPGISWQVRNQARMHIRNGDRPYRDIRDAMSFWLETATSVAARLGGGGTVEVLSAHGLNDLMAGIVRPTPRGEEKFDEFQNRVRSKNWAARWPGLSYAFPVKAEAS